MTDSFFNHAHLTWHTLYTEQIKEIFYFFLFYKIEFLLYSNLSVYICKISSLKLELCLLPPTPHKHLYFWSDHRTKGGVSK